MEYLLGWRMANFSYLTFTVYKAVKRELTGAGYGIAPGNSQWERLSWLVLLVRYAGGVFCSQPHPLDPLASHRSPWRAEPRMSRLRALVVDDKSNIVN